MQQQKNQEQHFNSLGVFTVRSPSWLPPTVGHHPNTANHLEWVSVNIGFHFVFNKKN